MFQVSDTPKAALTSSGKCKCKSPIIMLCIENASEQDFEKHLVTATNHIEVNEKRIQVSLRRIRAVSECSWYTDNHAAKETLPSSVGNG